MMNELFKEIKKDHKEVKDIFDKLEKAADGSSKKKDELFLQLRQEIMPHMEAEEHVFYPVLKEMKDARQDALEAIEEHHVSEMVLKELEKMPRDRQEWTAKFMVFKELVEHHIKEEESKIFSDAGKLMSRDQLEEIGEQFQQEKQRIKHSMKLAA
jgi:hemerythrin superfamily protein